MFHSKTFFSNENSRERSWNIKILWRYMQCILCIDHPEMLYPCLLCFPCLPCLAVVCHSSPAMRCLFKRNDTSATPALPWCANASLYPQLGDYHHSGGICLNRGVWMEGARGEEIYVGITTLSLTQLDQVHLACRTQFGDL